MSAVLVGVCGALVAAGLVAVIAGLRRTHIAPPAQRLSLEQRWARATRRPPGAAGRRRDRLLGAGLLLGLVVFAITGWVLAVPLVPLVVLVVPYLLGTPAQRDIIMMEALDRWVRTLATLIPTGKSVVDAVRAGRRQVPEAIAPEVERLIGRLDDRWAPEAALRAMADDLDSPDADSVVAALMLATRRGGTGATATLKALSDSIQDRLRARREIEAERAKPRVVVRQVTMITLIVLGASLLFGRDFLAPYATQIGQLIFAGLVAAYLGSMVMLRRLTNPPRRDRILVRRGSDREAVSAP
ncbi:Flp pilus assembly protein TadB [Naumannella cuiyingiana]|uniref:Flp pilus assembly protein TadB n=1 Tax=Naumannella cuiyingiana TaxID=1347891 RepID=A0A7Z0D8U7_9ACTN|nr:type II secretion system F family protein [Naumannella cuiyingiana]NYI71096.1 Flp pilus assembly protein TadB [Naumannella cuiyingiana]